MKKIWNFSFICCIFASIFHEGLSKQDSCSISYNNGTLLSRKMWRRGITLPPLVDTVGRGEELLVLKYEKNMALNFLTYINGKVLDDRNYVVRYDDQFEKKMYFSTHDFHEYEEFETQVNMTIGIPVSCDENDSNYPDTLVITIPITDTNNHAPEFLNKSYEYTLAMPLTKDFDITSLGQIVVKDIDLTNKDVTFTIDRLENKDKFSITFVEKHPLNLKHHVAKFVTTDFVNLDEDVTFALTATDSGDPPLSTSVNVTLKVDRANSQLRFSQPLYTADLTIYNNRKKTRIPLRFSEGHIVLTHGYNGNDVKFEMSEIADEFKRLFKLTVLNDTREEGKRVDVELTGVTDDFWNQRDFFVILKAVKGTNVATTVLYIRLSSTSLTISKQHTYVYTDRVAVTAFFVFTVLVLCYLAYSILFKNKTVTYDVNNPAYLNDAKIAKY